MKRNFHIHLIFAYKENFMSYFVSGWVQNLNAMLDRPDLGNLMQSIFKIINGLTPKEEYQSKHKFFKKRTVDL